MSIVNGLHYNNIRGDIFAGLTAAVVALPLALAMGVASGAGPIAGIYGVIFVGFFAALFGGTPRSGFSFNRPYDRRLAHVEQYESTGYSI